MKSEKTTLPSLRNIEWRTVKMETNKINQVLTYIWTNSITELRENWDPLKNNERKLKPWWEFRLETQIKNLRKQAQMIKQRKDAEICRNKKEKATQEKNKNTTSGNKPESTGENKELKKYRQR